MAAAPVTSNPQTPSEAPSDQQKQTNANGISSAEATANSLDNLDNPKFKDLQRSLRNALKKLNATAKVDSILAENSGKSLDELVADKKINNDQKAQALKKPSLQANVAQVEEQIAHYKQFANYYEERLASQKAELEKTHKEELESIQKNTVGKATETNEKGLRRQLLTLSKFLCAAAAMRRSGDESSSDSHAFEGVLYQVYGGSQEAVTSMLKLINGVDEKIVGVEGSELEITYGKVKQASEDFAPTPEEDTTEAAPASDPTLANAASTELQDTAIGANAAAPTTDPNVNAVAHTEQVAPPAQTMVSNAANPVAESKWDPNASASANADGWVEVPRDPAETDAGLQATPASVDTGLKNNPVAAQPSGQEAQNAAVPKQENGDGFEPVNGHQRQPSGRGRGRGDGFRGRGRGDFRGRGRGRGNGRGRGGSNGAPAASAPAPAAQ